MNKLVLSTLIFLTSISLSGQTPPFPNQNQIQVNSVETIRLNQHDKSFRKISVSNPDFAIIETSEYSESHLNWAAVAGDQSYSFKNFTFLDTLSTILNFKAVIYPVGVNVGVLTALRKQNILTAIRNGVSFYLQSEYDVSFENNQFFKTIIDSLGGSFTWGSTVSGTLAPTIIQAPFNLPNAITQLDNYWYGVNGSCDNTTVKPFLSFSGDDLGFYYVPPVEGAGVVVTTTDQDWAGVFLSTSHGENLMKNILAYLVNQSQLPVEMVSFSYTLQSNSMTLNWQTKTETNNFGWEIQTNESSKMSTVNWQKIGFVAGKGTTTEVQNYSFTLPVPKNSMFESFRLKQFDLDGKISFSNILNVNSKAGSLTLFQNYPNPFNPTTNISFYIAKSSKVELAVYDILGRQVEMIADGLFNEGFSQVTFDASKYTSGLYFYQLKAGGSTITKSMIVKK